MKSSRQYGELCYPFIHETSTLCDFEMVTDELCTLIGMALSAMPPEMADLAADLDQLQPLAFHVNGSIRGKLAVQAIDKTLNINIPPGTDSDKTFRLKEMGMPEYSNPKQRGDAYVRVVITVPKNLSEKDREVLSRFVKG